MTTATAFGALLAADIDTLSEDDLYAQLGQAVAGGDDAPSAELEGLANFKSNLSADGWRDWLRRLIDSGKSAFQRYWPQVRETVCDIYRQYEETEGSEWIERAAEAILGLINVSAAVAVLILKIAIKKGLDVMCPID